MNFTTIHFQYTITGYYIPKDLDIDPNFKMRKYK